MEKLINRLEELRKMIDEESSRLRAEATCEHDLEILNIYLAEFKFIEKLDYNFVDLCVAADELNRKEEQS